MAGADAAVLVTEWSAIVDLDWAAARRPCAHPWSSTAATPSTGGHDGPGVHVRGHRAHPGPGAGVTPAWADAGGHPRRGRGPPPAAAHRHPAQADDAAGGPPLRGAPARPTAPARHHRCRVLVRLPPGRAGGHFGDGSAMGMRAAVRRGPRAARHRRRDQERPGAARRRGRARAERGHPHRPRPRRDDRAPSRDGRRRHAGAHAGGRPQRVRPGAPARRLLRGGLRREAQPEGAAPRRAPAHQRRHLPAGAVGRRLHPRRPRLLDRARDLPAARRRRAPVRLPERRLLARHRDPRLVPGGPSRRALGRGGHGVAHRGGLPRPRGAHRLGRLGRTPSPASAPAPTWDRRRPWRAASWARRPSSATGPP